MAWVAHCDPLDVLVVSSAVVLVREPELSVEMTQ